MSFTGRFFLISKKKEILSIASHYSNTTRNSLVWEMLYLTLMVALGVFTCLDALVTVVGMGVGCVELNPVVTMWGVQLWVVFRMLLLGCMLTLFFTCYQLCLKHFPKGLWMLRTTLFMLNFYIGAVVFSGFLAVYSKLLL